MSYLGGHSYSGKRGQRLFLNALFEADCVTNSNWPGEIDSDGDGVPNGDDPFPTDPYRCGDSDGDTCDDCSVTGTFDPANDGPDEDGDGICDDGEDEEGADDADGGGGCCQSSGSGTSVFLIVFGVFLVLRRRTSR